MISISNRAFYHKPGAAEMSVAKRNPLQVVRIASNGSPITAKAGHACHNAHALNGYCTMLEPSMYNVPTIQA
jgi:hypothetical protein